MIFYRFTSTYIFNKPRAKANMRKAINIKIEILLSLEKAFLTSLFWPAKIKLWQIYGSAIWLTK